METNKKLPIIPKNTPISLVECSKAFQLLSKNDQLYAYYFTRASWEGCKILYFQRSYESPALLYLFGKIFSTQTIEEIKAIALKNGISEEEYSNIIRYIAGVVKNCGNYLDYGDSKFIPDVPEQQFYKFITLTKFYEDNKETVTSVWDSIKKEVYEYEAPYYEIGFRDNDGLSSYYSSNITRKDAEFVSEALKSQKISPLNTRVIKNDDKNYTVLVASVDSSEKKFTYQEVNFLIRYGDFSAFLKKVIENLEQCLKYCANANQENMLKAYIEHFKTGDVEPHKESQRHWIKDKNPIVETNIGFIETYLDPLQVRGMWEGWVSIVNKEQSAILDNLVENAENILPLLPWPREFEKDQFLKPNFTSLEVVSYAHGGVPLGINLPNYDEITQNEGFKNVNLGNCYYPPKVENLRFIEPEDKEIVELYLKYFNDALFLKVALHELLGHGSGKLFYSKEGKFNFEKGTVKNPITGEIVDSFYVDNELWNMRFGDITNAYEECRADCVALYLSCFDEPMKILFPGREKEWDDIRYICWYQFLHVWIKGLEVYNHSSAKWGEAHRQGNHVIVKALIDEGENFIRIRTEVKDGKEQMYIGLDRTKINTVGKRGIQKLLLQLQVYKTTGDAERGRKMFNEYSKVSDEIVKYREIMIENKVPRSMELQYELELKDGEKVELKKFAETFEGIIEMNISHYRGNFDDILPIWKEYQKDFRC